MNQRFLKKLSRYCAIALICAMIAIPAAPSWGTSYAAPVPIAKATGPDSLALGDSAKSIGSFSAAIGYGAKTTGDYSIAIGKEAYTLAEYSTAIGTFSDAFFPRSVALGYKSGATATDQVSIGTYKYDPTYDWIYTRTLVGLKSSIAGATGATFGDKLNTAAATDNGKYAAVNVQDLAEAIKGSGTGTNSYQAGVGAKATDDRATAIGVSAQATDDRTTAIGASAQATGFYSTASGYMAQATGGYSTAVGNMAQATKIGSAALGYNAKATGDRSAALGTGAQASGNYSTTVGNSAQATGVDSTALGYNAKANIDNSTALGSNAQATGYYSTALGYNAQATNSSTAVGRNAKATGDYSTALGDNAEATELSATAIGRYAAATHRFGVALGYNSNTTAADQVSIGQYNSGWQTTRTLVGLKSSISTDAGADGKTFVQKLGDAAADDNGKYAAVNVSDLKSLADEISYTSGDNVTIRDDNSVNLNDKIKLTDAGSLTVGTSSLTTSALKIGGVEYINASGFNANNKKITNVAKGETATDAANVGQLITITKGSNISLKETTNANGSKNYEISATGGGSGGKLYAPGKNINFTDDDSVINLDDKISLTSAGSIDIGTKTKISDGKLIVGDGNTATGYDSVALGGENNTASYRKSVVIGGEDNTTPDSGYGYASVVVGGSGNAAYGYTSALLGGERNETHNLDAVAVGGGNNKANGAYSVTLGGQGGEAADEYSVAVGGKNNIANGVYSVTLGGQSGDAWGEYSVAIGGGEANGNNSVAIGSGVETSTKPYEVAIGSSNENKLTFGDTDIAASGQKIRNLAEGETGTDAATVGQTVSEIEAGSTNVSVVESTADDGSKKYKISVTGGGSGGKIYTAGKNIKLTDPDQSVINLDDNVKLAEEGSLSVGDKKYIDANGLNANDKKVTNVAAGTADSDAVNYGQLKAQKEAAEKYADEKADGAVTTAKKYTDDSIAPVKKYVTDDGLNANDKKITNVAKGETATDAARIDQLDKYVEGDSIKIEEDGTDPTTGQTKYKISAVGAGFLEGGDNINVTDGKINLENNVQLTKDGSVTIGTEEDNTQIIVGEETPWGTKGIRNISKAVDGKASITVVDYESFMAKVSENGEAKQASRHTAAGIDIADAATPGVNKLSGFTADRLGIEVSQDGKVSYGSGLTAKGLEVADLTNPEEQKMSGLAADKFALTISKDGGVVQGNGISAKGMEVLEKTEDGKIAGASVNTQVIGIAVSEDNKLSYGTGVTAKGIEVADHSAEDVNKAAHFSSDIIAIAESDKNHVINKAAVTNADGFVASSGPLDNPDKVVALTMGTSQQGQEYEAGLYIADATKKEHSALTTSELTVANKTYIDKNGINANDRKITNVANGSVAQYSKDAVNGGQLWDAYNRTGSRIDNVVTDMNSRFNEVYDDMSSVGSQAAAMSALQAIPYNPYAPTTITAGLGFYRSDQAVAVGVYHYIRDSVLLNIGGAFNLNGHGDAMGRAGVSFAVGKGAGKGGQSVGRDMTEMQKMMADMQKKISDLEAKDKEKDKIIEELKNALDEKKK